MRLSQISEKRWGWGGILAIAALLYGLLLRRYPIGTYNDDAAYVLGAKALLQGHYYRSLNLPDHPFVNLYPPGFPLILAPFVKLFQPAWSYLKIVPLSFMLMSCLCLFKLFEEWLDPVSRLVLLALFAWNPLTATFAGLVMSESCLLFASLAIFLVLKKHLLRPGWADVWILGGLMAWASLIRFEGFFLIPAVALGLGYEKRWKTFSLSTFLALAVWSLIHAAAPIPNDHVRFGIVSIASDLSQTGGVRYFGHHVLSLFNVLVMSNLLAIQLNEAIPVGYLSFLLMVMGILFMGVGAWQLWMKKPQFRGLTLAVGFYCTLYTGAHAIWPSVEIRYLVPIVPFIMAAIIEGVKCVGLLFFSLRSAGIPLLVAAGLVYGHKDINAVRSAWRPSSELLPQETLTWINAHVPKTTTILTAGAETIYLYTDVFATGNLSARDAEEFHYQLLAHHIDYILLQPYQFYSLPMPGMDIDRLWALRRQWIENDPGAFAEVYANRHESRQIYEVNVANSVKFQQAFQEYLSAYDAMGKGLWQDAFTKLDSALRFDPALTSAMNGYGVACLLSNQRTERGIQLLQNALKIRPDYALAMLNLARLLHKRGDKDASRHYLEKASDSIRRTREFESLLPVIDREKAAL